MIWHNAHLCTLLNIGDPMQQDELRIMHSNYISHMSPFAIYEIDESDIDADSNERLNARKVPVEWSDKLRINVIRQIWVAWYGNIPEYKLALESKTFVRPNDFAVQAKSLKILGKFHEFLSRDYSYKDNDGWLACFQHWDWSVCHYVATHDVGSHDKVYEIYSCNPWFPEPFNMTDSEPYATRVNNSGGRIQVTTLYGHQFYIRERDAQIERAIYAASQRGNVHIRHEPVRSTPFTNVQSIGNGNKKRRRTPFSIVIDDAAFDLASFVSLLRPYAWCGYMAVDINCETRKTTHYLLIDEHMTEQTPLQLTEAAIANMGFSRTRVQKCPQHVYIRAAHAATHAEIAHYLYNIDIEHPNLTWHIHGDGSLYAFHSAKGLLLRSLRDLTGPWQPCARKPLSRGHNEPLCSTHFLLTFEPENEDNMMIICDEPKEGRLYVIERKFDKILGICIRPHCFRTMHTMVFKPVKVYDVPARVFVGDVWGFAPNTFPFARIDDYPAACPYMLCRAAALCGKAYNPCGANPIKTPIAPLKTPTLLLTLIETHRLELGT